MNHNKRTLTGLTMAIASINIYGISKQEKYTLLTQFFKDTWIGDVLCKKLTENVNTSKINGMELVDKLTSFTTKNMEDQSL